MLASIIFSIVLLQQMPAPCSSPNKISVGVYQNYPQVFFENSQVVKGIYIDILDYIATRENWHYDYVPGTWSQCLERLNTGEIDLLVSIAYTEERSKLYDFTKETVLSNWGQIYTTTPKIQSVLDLSNKKIAVVKDDISYIGLKEVLKRFDVPCDYIEVPEYMKVLECVDNHTSDAGAVSRIFGLMNESKFNIHKSPIIYNPIELKFASLKSEPQEIIEKIDSHLKDLKSNSDSIYYQSLNLWLAELGQWMFPNWLKYLIGISAALVFILGFGSFILKIQVKKRTTELHNEIRIRKEKENELKIYHENLESLVKKRTTELSETNARIQKSEERYRNILDSIEEGYIETDLDGMITFFNSPACRISGYNEKDLMGMDFRQFTRGDHYDTFDKSLKSLIQSQKNITLSEIDIPKRNGEKAYLNLSISTVNNHDSQITGYRAIIRDISDEYKAEQIKSALEVRLQQTQRIKAIGTLAGGIAHDFNNLLMGIQGNVSLMLLNANKEKDHYKNLKNIEMCIESGANLARQLLGFARGGKYEVRPTNLNDIVKKTAMMFSRTRKEISIEENYRNDLWLVDADQGQVEQVLMNIYINAWHAMPQGGTICLRTDNCNLDENDVKPFGLKPGRFVKVDIKDTGVGMSKEIQQRIFEPFFTTRELGRGTGLGLASAFGIIKNHSGGIYARSILGKGTTISFFLPESAGKGTRTLEMPEMIQIGSETILLVDDEAMILNTGKAMLEELGYKVIIADGGKKAIDIYRDRHHEISLVILDVVMPFFSGADVYKELKSVHPDVKILFSSGYSMDDDQTGGLINAGNHFIQKPFSLHKLSITIRNILDVYTV